MCILDHLQALLHPSSPNVFAVVLSNRHVQDMSVLSYSFTRTTQACKDAESRLKFYHILTLPIIYEIMTRASLLHEPIIRYPAQEEWALRRRFSYDGYV